jgi:1-acyl-sn-glycerol-3-phosphate acyltransferase
MVEMGTSIAVLAGMMAGGSLMALGDFGATAASILVVAVAVIGYFASRSIPPAPATAPELKFNFNAAAETFRALRYIGGNRTIFNAVLGISWFWFFGTVFTAQLPGYTQVFLGGGEGVLNLTLALFSIGVGIGSLLCERLSGHKVEIGLVPFGSIGMTVFAVDLYFARPLASTLHGLGMSEFLLAHGSWRIVLDLILIGLFAGLYIVPLFALVQSRTERSELSRVIAGNNILNALFMVVAAGLGLGLTALRFSIPQIFLCVAAINALVAIYIYTLVPEFLMRFLSWIVVKTLYRIDVEGLEKIPDEGAAVLVCNHVSFVDPLIVMGVVRRPIRFVMYYRIYQLPLLNFIFRTARTIPIAGRKEDPVLLEAAFDEVDRALAAGELVCIFPEGGITRDGDIAPFKPGVEKIIERRPVPVIPLAVRGLWGSVFSRRDSWLGRSRLPRRFRSHIAVVVGAPVPAAEACVETLEQRVRELRGTWA